MDKDLELLRREVIQSINNVIGMTPRAEEKFEFIPSYNSKSFRN